MNSPQFGERLSNGDGLNNPNEGDDRITDSDLGQSVDFGAVDLDVEARNVNRRKTSSHVGRQSDLKRKSFSKNTSFHFMSLPVMSFHAMSFHVMACFFMVCHFMSWQVISCHVLLVRVMLCYFVSCYVILCHVMLFHVMLCYFMSCHVISSYFMCCHLQRRKVREFCIETVTSDRGNQDNDGVSGSAQKPHQLAQKARGGRERWTGGGGGGGDGGLGPLQALHSLHSVQNNDGDQAQSQIPEFRHCKTN